MGRRPVVEQDEHHGDADAFLGEAVAVSPAVAFHQPVSLHLPHVIPQLREGVGLRGQPERGQEGGVDLDGTPACELSARMEQDLHEPDHPRVAQLDARNAGSVYGDGKGDPLEQRKVDVRVERFRFEAGEAIRRDGERLPQRLEIGQPLIQPEILQPVDTDFHARKRGELFVQARDEALAVTRMT